MCMSVYIRNICMPVCLIWLVKVKANVRSESKDSWITQSVKFILSYFKLFKMCLKRITKKWEVIIMVILIRRLKKFHIINKSCKFIMKLIHLYQTIKKWMKKICDFSRNEACFYIFMQDANYSARFIFIFYRKLASKLV